MPDSVSKRRDALEVLPVDVLPILHELLKPLQIATLRGIVQRDAAVFDLHERLRHLRADPAELLGPLVAGESEDVLSCNLEENQETSSKIENARAAQHAK